MGGGDPVDDPLDLTALRFPSSGSIGVVDATKLDDLPGSILDDFFTANDVGVAQTNFPTWNQSMEALWWILVEIILFDENFTTHRNRASPTIRKLLMNWGIQLFFLIFWPVKENNFQRTQDGHCSGGLGVQIFTDTVFQNAHVDVVFSLGDTDSFSEQLKTFGGVSPASQA